MIPRFYRVFRNAKLRTKLLCSYLVVVLIPVFLIGYILIWQNTKIMLQQTNRMNQVDFKQLTNNFNNELQQYIQITDNIATDNQLLSYLDDKYSINDDRGEKYLAYNNIYLNYELKINFIELSGEKLSIYTDNPGVLTGTNFIYALNENVRNQQWCADILAGRGANVVGTPYTGANKALSVPLGRMLTFQDTGYNNFIMLDIPEQNLYNLIANESKNKNIYVVNHQGYVITSSNRSLVGRRIAEIPGTGLSALDAGSSEGFAYRNEMVYSGTFGEAGTDNECKIIEVISTASMMSQIYQNIQSSFLICLFSLIVTVLLVLLFSNQLTKRLQMLAKNMADIHNGNFRVYVNYNEDDEIGDISKSFKSMVDRINSLISEVYQADIHIRDLEIRKKETELHALYSQINPHFIFNTMESVRMNLLKNGEKEVSEIIRNFSALLRQSINWSEDIISLKQDFDLAESYLKIQKFRFKDKLEYELDLPKELETCRIPKFTLQPLIENAIRHGLEPKTENGFIRVRAEKFEGGIRVTVKDNGVGIDSDRLQEVSRQLTAFDGRMEKKNSIGMKNVHDRIRLHFDKNYGLKIISIQDVGTEIVITIPDSGLPADANLQKPDSL